MSSGRSPLFSLFFLFLVALLIEAEDPPPVEKPQNQITYYDKAVFEKLAKEDPTKVDFFLSRFAEAEYEPKCNVKTAPIIVPVYFNAGGNVELPCKMCEWVFVVNGLPKMWKHIPLHHVNAFLKKPEDFLRNHGKDEAYVQSLARSMKPAGGGFHRRARLLRRNRKDKVIDATDSETETELPTQTIASIHQYIQADGRLYIHGTMLESSGIYFCYDENLTHERPRVFFLLNAMAPLVYHSKAIVDETFASLWNVDKWLTSGQDYEKACETEPNHPMPDEFAHMRYAPADYSKLKNKTTLPITLKRLADDLGLTVEHEKGDWSACEEGKQYREVHCVLKNKRGVEIPEQAQDNLQFAPALNAYFKRFQSLRLHSYFLTSLIYKGSTYGEPDGKSHDTCGTRAVRLWNAFEEAILPSLLGKTQAQLKGEAARPDFMNNFGAKNDCYDLHYGEGWWSLRGLSFIDTQKCPPATGK